MKSIDKYSLCPCDSRLPYAKCCRKYHQGEKPPTARLLMRSRYSAYALGLSDYIMASTHKTNPAYNENKEKWRADLDAFSENTSFTGLKVHADSEDGDAATVSFTAYLRQGGEDATFFEKSDFVKENGAWYYKSGAVREY